MRGRTLLRLAAAMALVLALVVGCGGGGGQPPQGEEEAKVRGVPEYGDLRPGKYETDEFEPAFSFEVVGEGWLIGGAEEPGILDMRQGVEGGAFLHQRAGGFRSEQTARVG